MTDVDNPEDHNAKADELLAVRCQLGEPAAFDELIHRWQQPLWTYVRRVVGEDDAAKEVMQDTWLRVVRGVAGLRDGSKLRAWLFAVARRTLMDRFRAQYAAVAASNIDVGEIAADAPDDDREAELQMLDRALARLPIVEREVLTLFYLRELSLVQVADTLDVPVGTIKSRLFRARQLLRRELAAER